MVTIGSKQQMIAAKLLSMCLAPVLNAKNAPMDEMNTNPATPHHAEGANWNLLLSMKGKANSMTAAPVVIT